MKNQFYFIALLVINSLLFSCSSDEDLNYQNDFAKSEKAFLNFKVASNNSYKYIVTGRSVFISNDWETTITVSNGVIIQRDFKYTDDQQNVLDWTENENEINSHENSFAASALTLDNIYDKAKKEWLIKRNNAKVYFESKNNGLLSKCGYVENGCMDDCFFGITIKKIERL